MMPSTRYDADAGSAGAPIEGARIHTGGLDATGMRFAIVAARFNHEVTAPLCSGAEQTLRIGKYEFRSRLFVGTGKYPSLEVMQAAHAASGAEVVTVAIRRMHLDDKSGRRWSTTSTARG